MKFKVVIADDRHGKYEEEKGVLETIGAAVVLEESQDAEVLAESCRDADGIILNLAPFGAGLVGKLEKCRVISRYGVGYDNVDLAAATAAGIQVANVPDYCGEDVSDQAMALFLSCVRNVALRDRQVRSGTWAIGSTAPQYRVRGKNFVLCGYGGIARIMHRKIRGFEPGRVLVYDPYVPGETIRSADAEKVDWETALAEGDFFSIHLPVTPETKGMFDDRAFGRMKRTAIVINTSRGPVLDEEALCRALREKRIAAAGLDVFNREPVDPGNPLLDLDNITVSGHVGFYTEESMAELKTKAAVNVLEVLSGRRPPYPVNDLPGGSGQGGKNG